MIEMFLMLSILAGGNQLQAENPESAREELDKMAKFDCSAEADKMAKMCLSSCSSNDECMQGCLSSIKEFEKDCHKQKQVVNEIRHEMNKQR